MPHITKTVKSSNALFHELWIVFPPAKVMCNCYDAGNRSDNGQQGPHRAASGDPEVRDWFTGGFKSTANSQ